MNNKMVEALYFILKDIRSGETFREETLALIKAMDLCSIQVALIDVALSDILSGCEIWMDDSGSITLRFEDKEYVVQ